MKIFDAIFYRTYKYYGKETGLLYSTTLLAGIICLIAVGVYIIIFKSLNTNSDPMWFLNSADLKTRFRLVVGPIIIISIQQGFYWRYRYKDYYKKASNFYEVIHSNNTISKYAHVISFCVSILFFLSSFFIGDFINTIRFK